jgi:hypothetical protein
MLMRFSPSLLLLRSKHTLLADVKEETTFCLHFLFGVLRLSRCVSAPRKKERINPSTYSDKLRRRQSE